jgi:glycerol uptake facilitator-like aquaporin
MALILFAPISGGHFNPGITLMMTILKRMSLLDCFLYMIA